jgi:hypothetical protein
MELPDHQDPSRSVVTDEGGQFAVAQFFEQILVVGDAGPDITELPLSMAVKDADFSFIVAEMLSGQADAAAVCDGFELRLTLIQPEFVDVILGNRID